MVGLGVTRKREQKGERICEVDYSIGPCNSVIINSPVKLNWRGATFLSYKVGKSFMLTHLVKHFRFSEFYKNRGKRFHAECNLLSSGKGLMMVTTSFTQLIYFQIELLDFLLYLDMCYLESL